LGKNAKENSERAMRRAKEQLIQKFTALNDTDELFFKS
jgi:hypothetical protein